MKQVIAFGDSNTWGLNPVLKNRYPENVRWTGILRRKLSHKGFLLVEEGHQHAILGIEVTPEGQLWL